MDATRRLAAILFADIAGYTALMQNDERQALACLQTFKQELETQVPAHHGEIIQYYGDACLVIFHSSVDAVRCALALQQAFREDPGVPVRIGLHAGEVVLREGNVFGDAVNIASRVESMAIPGAVLLSSSVQNQIKNQEGFRLTSLGRFEFKNVEDAMTVYALANEGLTVPRPEAITGKLKEKEKEPEKRPAKKPLSRWLFPLAAILLLVSGIFLWQRGSAKHLLPAEIREARIGVLPYENNTNDTTLNILGNMAADWITRTLMNLEGLRIAQFDNVKEHQDLLRDRPDRFAEQTGAERLIRGRFYEEDGELIFESQIIDPSTSEVVFALPVIRGNREKPSQLVSELSQRIAGYFAFRKYDMLGFSVAPRYEAFVAFEQGIKFFGKDYDQARSYFQKAMDIDSNFLAPFIFHAASYINRGQWAVADSLCRGIRERFGQLPRQEEYFLSVAEAIIDGDLENEYASINKLLAVDPKPFAVNYQYGNTALKVNRPQSIVDAFQQLDPASLTFDIPAKTWWFSVYTQALIRLGRLEDALRIIRMVPPETNPMYFLRQWIFTLQNRPDSLEQLIREMEDRGEPEPLIVDQFIRIAVNYAIQGDRVNQMAWGSRAIDRINKRPESAPLPRAQLADAYYFSEDYEKALPEYQSLLRSEGEAWWILVRLGCIQARLGNRDAALEYIQKLAAKETKYAHGQFTYAQALVYASLDEREKALTLMKQAFQEGYAFDLTNYAYAFEFIPLHGYAPFEAFVRPK